MRRIVSALFFIVGLALLASAFLAAPAARTATSERILRVNVNSTDITYLDPALNYDFYGWRLEAATCAMLLGYPDKAGPASARLYPEVAKGFPKVSGNGKTYTLHAAERLPLLRRDPGDRRRATRARSSAPLHPKMQSPAATFFSDIVGADKVLAGQGHAARPVSTANGNTLTIRLTKAAPDFMSRIAMPSSARSRRTCPIDPRAA